VARAKFTSRWPSVTSHQQPVFRNQESGIRNPKSPAHITIRAVVIHAEVEDCGFGGLNFF
jgi:hypothetical protein